MPKEVFEITRDDLGIFADRGPMFVTFGEVMVRNTPGDDVLFQIGERILTIGNPEVLEGTVSEQLIFPVERTNK